MQKTNLSTTGLDGKLTRQSRDRLLLEGTNDNGLVERVAGQDLPVGEDLNFILNFYAEIIEIF